MTPSTSQPSSSNAGEFSRAQHVLVGGVNSAVRAFRAVGGTPRFIAKAQGPYMWDVEGKRYVDYLQSWGPMVLGHGHPKVLEAVHAAVDRGLSYGAPNVYETLLAEKICALFAQVEKVRFTSSGTEAAMSALRLARGYTGRTKILKFEGCYHGTADSLLVKAGSGALAFGTPSSAGVPADLAKHTLVATFNDLESVKALFDEHGDDIACVMVEPYAGNMNLIKPAAGFHQGLRELCTQFGALLIFDEVMTGFRLALGGAQQLIGVQPDMTAFGKVIGGGMPVGAIGGPAAVMDKMAPLGPVYQAGTLSGNPIAMAAGLATIEQISVPGFYDQLSRRCADLVAGLNTLGREAGLAFSAHSEGSMAGMFMLAQPPRSFAEVMTQDVETFKKLYHGCMERGVYFPPSAVEAFFFSDAHRPEQVAFTLEVVRDAMKAL